MENLDTNTDIIKNNENVTLGGGLIISLLLVCAGVLYLLNTHQLRNQSNTQRLVAEHLVALSRLQQTVHQMYAQGLNNTQLKSQLERQDSIFALRAILLQKELINHAPSDFVEKLGGDNEKLRKVIRGFDSAFQRGKPADSLKIRTYLLEIEEINSSIISRIEFYSAYRKDNISSFRLYFLPILFLLLAVGGVILISFYWVNHLIENLKMAFSNSATYRTLHAILQGENKILILQNKKLEEKAGQIELLKEQVEHAESEIQKLEAQFSEKEQELAQAQFKIKELSLLPKELELTRNKLRQFELELQKLEDEKMQLLNRSAPNQNLDLLQAEWDQEKKNLEQNIKSLKYQLGAYQALYNIFQKFKSTAFVTFDIQGKLISMSKAAEKLLEQHFSACQGKEFIALLAPEYLTELGVVDATSLQILVHFFKYQRQNEENPIFFDFQLPGNRRKKIPTYIYSILHNASQKSMGFVLHLLAS
jgi:PAS domain-containing protein